MKNTEQQQIKQQRPYFLILLPIFFVLHAYAENYGFISFRDTFTLTALYLAMALLIYLFSYFFFRDWLRAALICSLWMAIFFFFGALHDFLIETLGRGFFSSYSFLLPAAILFLVWLFIFLKKTPKRFYRFTVFLNTLLLLYIMIDILTVAWKITLPKKNDLSVYDFAGKKEFKQCDTCKKPDIYFLLFDEYGSSVSLKEQYNYGNDIDSLLTAKGFNVQTKSRSNYNYTSFSMSSILNMSYIYGLKNPNALTLNEFINSNRLIEYNQSMMLLESYGYDVVNYSMFDIMNAQSLVKQYFLPLKKKLISDRTLFYRINRDIGWLLYSKLSLPINPNRALLTYLHNNDIFVELVKETASKKSGKPRFIYAHFSMPHFPYFFDKDNRRRDDSLALLQRDMKMIGSYLGYLPYVNTKIIELVNTIQHNNPDAVIIIMGDHGFRSYPTPPNPLPHFQNLNAVYFPDRDYKGLYESITGANQFRVIFNKMWHLGFPIIKDSCTYLEDKN
ncbi:MAG: sulfatase-like hydrolase/transferase [Chitinophagaceae bacterium]|nr:sulfatase-like hydrolase/transferase [Chitinophagaceae bacterium]